jgi:hypothetical protein
MLRVVVILGAAVLLVNGCGGGGDKYAGLSRNEARQAALHAMTGQRNVDPQPIDEQKSKNTLGGDAWIVQFNGQGGEKWCVWVWKRSGDPVGSGFATC